jgi:hypothetical protein
MRKARVEETRLRWQRRQRRRRRWRWGPKRFHHIPRFIKEIKETPRVALKFSM